jgi:hypothetical protein
MIANPLWFVGDAVRRRRCTVLVEGGREAGEQGKKREQFRKDAILTMAI